MAGPRRSRLPCDYFPYVFPYVPDLLVDLPLDIPGHLAADISDAERELARFEEMSARTRDFEGLARFLLRAEAVASSKIEGLQVGPRRLAQHEVKLAAGITDGDPTADAILANVAAIRLSVDHVAAAPVFTLSHLLGIHRALMEHSDHPQWGGQIREQQNWLGGNDYNPCGADFVPPPPQHLPGLLEDLCAFINSDGVSPLTQAALVHAQFETIHPFTDGNGRTGRALIHVVLKRRGLVAGFVPPISLVLATRSSAYIGGLTSFRSTTPTGGEAARAGVMAWLEVFVDAAHQATTEATRLSQLVRTMEDGWREQVQPRRGSAADRLLALLPAHPVVTAELVASLTGASRAAAFTAIDQLSESGVLSLIGTGRRNRLFEARGVLDLLADVERALATPGGNTRTADLGATAPARRAK